jgi:hypothetical protein
MFTIVIAHPILDHFSKEAVRWIIGGFLLIPMAIVPIIVTVALFVGLREVASIRKVGILNLIVASGVILVCLLIAAFSAAIATVIHPAEDVLNSGPLLVGYVCSLIDGFTWLCLALAISIWLLFGLLRIRRDIFSGGMTMPNNALQPTANAPSVLTDK